VDIMRNADWLVELGPEAGDGGGSLIYAGPPAGIKKIPESHTANFI